MRNAFSMIVAISVLVMIATIGALSLSLSTQTSKQTGDIYLRTQAELLAQSATEYAILVISDHNISDAPNFCIDNIDIEFEPTAGTTLFDINISVMYIGQTLPTANCNDINNTIQTIDSNITVIIDTTVTLNQNTLSTTEPIRIHRRTLQKP